MKPRTLLFVSPLIVTLGLAACDGRNYEAEVTALSEELSATQTELDAAISENERLRSELQEMRAQPTTDDAGAGDPAAGSEGMAPALSQAVHGELEAMAEKLTVALAGLDALEAQTENGELSEVRSNLEEAVGSAQTLLTVVGGQQTAPAGGETAPETPAGAAGEAPPEVMEEAPQGAQEPAQQ